MKRLLYGLLAVVCAGPAQAHSFNRPPDVTYAVPDAVDHVIEMEITTGIPHHLIVTRRGDWVRETHPNFAGYSYKQIVANLKTGQSWTFNDAITAERGTLSFQRLRVTKPHDWVQTDQTDTILGESCISWKVEQDKYTETFCLTKDGLIVQYKRFVGRSEDVVARAVRIERRRVSLTKVKPPEKLFKLANWGNWTAMPDTSPNYEVTLDKAHTFRRKTKKWVETVRRLGNHQIENRVNEDGTVFRTYTSGRTRIELRQDAQGIYEVNVERQTDDILSREMSGEKSRTETIAGESCVWIINDHDHGYSYRCVTRDSAVLAVSSGYVSNNIYDKWDDKATSFRRGHLKPADVRPPADLLSPDFNRLPPF
ncbi:hypothetical protein PQU92_06480 [Asticcacaulis sp. BYS171W]|uniref:Uncharacterized protein n=1 Tax=Asticcacaulis aquaticus TaxID=2984212 RepID=A0ABT5HSE1_9CAUL|nr:hypothetical protein [Asticcacaulis aquaticus]MDC7682914.1 hypothetical protein [Asticcacaulis aquaticus]